MLRRAAWAVTWPTDVGARHWQQVSSATTGAQTVGRSELSAALWAAEAARGEVLVVSDSESEKGGGPPLQQALAYDDAVRRDACQRINEGEDFASAFSLARSDTTVKEQNFSTPVGVAAATSRVDQLVAPPGWISCVDQPG